MKRPDWVHCIRKPKEDEKRMSWCGRRVEVFEFALEGLDHAASLQESRAQPCPECVDAAVAELNGLRYDPGEGDQPASTEQTTAAPKPYCACSSPGCDVCHP